MNPMGAQWRKTKIELQMEREENMILPNVHNHKQQKGVKK